MAGGDFGGGGQGVCFGAFSLSGVAGRAGPGPVRPTALSRPQACIDENLEVVRFLVEQGATVNQADNEGWTPLHVAASCGYLDIAR